jgi:2-oxo-4-hydroxy-4-carboxy--5-ureidoimidazoline (OHCU) decarboxylase
MARLEFGESLEIAGLSRNSRTDRLARLKRVRARVKHQFNLPYMLAVDSDEKKP